MNREFCKRLKELREERGISQSKMAKSIGTYQQTIARWEKGITEPDIEMIGKICLFFEISADFLLGLNDNNY